MADLPVLLKSFDLGWIMLACYMGSVNTIEKCADTETKHASLSHELDIGIKTGTKARRVILDAYFEIPCRGKKRMKEYFSILTCYASNLLWAFSIDQE